MVHYRRFDSPPLPLGKSSITYTVFDDTSFPEPIEASVTVIYQHQDGLGLEEKSLYELAVYPNPATGDIHIISRDDLKGKVNINIYNSLGYLVKRSSVSAENNRITIPVDDLQAGCYYGHLENTTNEIRVFRFIK